MNREIERQRLAAKKAHRLALSGDVERLMGVLKHESPEVWQSYSRTVAQEGQIEADTFNTIHQTVLRLFDAPGTEQICDLLRRMLEMTRSELGMPPFPDLYE